MDKTEILNKPEFFDWFKKYTKANSANAWWHNHKYESYADIEHEIGADFGGVEELEAHNNYYVAHYLEHLKYLEISKKLNDSRRVDVMIDIETLGTQNDTTVFQLSAVAFDIVTGDLLEGFDATIDIATIKNMVVTGDTIKWWLRTDAALLNRLINTPGGTEHEVYGDFAKWLVELQEIYDVYVWGNGISFDIVKVKTKMENLDILWPIAFRKERDVRTIVDAFSIVHPDIDIKEKFSRGTLDVPHNGLYDCIHQIKFMHYIWGVLFLGKEVQDL